jgi:hypothetical protein
MICYQSRKDSWIDPLNCVAQLDLLNDEAQLVLLNDEAQLDLLNDEAQLYLLNVQKALAQLFSGSNSQLRRHIQPF